MVKTMTTLREVVASVTGSTVLIITECHVGSGGEAFGSWSINTSTIGGSDRARTTAKVA